MVNKCKSYHLQPTTRYTYHPLTGRPIAHDIEVGVCWGTKECDQCNCGGDMTWCDFYPDVRVKALKEQEPKFGEWISIEERLPDLLEEVLAYRGNYISCLMNVYTYMGGEMWKDEYGFIGSMEDEGITHWMPLPTPPKD